MRNTDLHTHSYYSDGQISPKELVRLAKKRGIKNLALTDHNSVKGVKEAIAEGKKIGVSIIPAIEVRCREDEILGYFIDIKNKKLIKEIKKDNKKVQEKVKVWCNNIKKKGYKISFAEIWKKYPKARGNLNEFYPLFELSLKGYGKPFKIAKELKQKNIKGKKIKEMTLVQAIRLVKNAKGVPVLAHPWLNGEVLDEKNFKKYVNAGLKGIELNNGDRIPLRKKKHDKKIKQLAKKYKLILTSGSDFHGEKLAKNMPGNHNLGKSNCDEKVVYKLKNLAKIWN